MKRLIFASALLSAIVLIGFSGNASACQNDGTTYFVLPVTEEHQTDGKPIFVVKDRKTKGHWYCSDNDTDCKGFLKIAVQCEHHVNMLHTPDHKHDSDSHGDKHTH
tara:strand:- start:2261 stop:2578 length:318 start_codon:yes stop_codon:yes gene_type:complete